MIIWDKNFIKEEVVEEEPLGAPFSVEETVEAIAEPETVMVEIQEDLPKQGWSGMGFGGR
jgi:hypothetical protein